MTKKRAAGLSLSYRKTLDILTIAFRGQFPSSYSPGYADELARELAEELLRPALAPAARARLDAMKAREPSNGKVPA